MGHQNTRFTRHMIDMQTDRQGRLHPEPRIFYNFPQPHNIRSVVPAAGNRRDFNLFRHVPERNGSPFLIGIPPPHHPVPNIDLAIGQYNPYLAGPPPASRDFSAQPGHGIFGIQTTDNYGRNISYMDGLFKRKIAESVRNPSAGPSSSVAAPLYSCNDPATIVESGSRSGHLVRGSFVAPQVGWMHAPPTPPHPLPSFVQGHPNIQRPPLPMQGVRGYNVNLPSQVSPSSGRVSTISYGRPTFVAPTGFHLYRPPQQRDIILDPCARPHHTLLPHLRVLPEDEVAILEIPGYGEAGDSIDRHREMRLDIDHMSYEELLALGEEIGSVGTGLSEEFIKNNLKIRTFTSLSAARLLDSKDGTCGVNQQINFCVICQTDYENEQDIGTVDCGHEYHRECINKWLLLKNTCPVCKSAALRSRKSGGPI